ncbi:MAG: MFS transporter [Calditrichaeota bacterium]|nr:MAG: MFS transporter [Calditrichota bacterium]
MSTSAEFSKKKDNLFTTLQTMPKPFWMVNIMEMLERLAYYGVRVVIPIYIAQADEIGGLHFSHIDKGIIFFWWAIFQSITPMFSGGFADRYGYKKTIAVSVFIKILGYILMATQTEFWPFFIGCCTLALGTAIFKPGVQGTMCQSLTTRNSSVGWGLFYMLVNIGGFLGPPLAHYLYGIGWPAVFYGCAAIVSLNLLMLLTYKDPAPGGEQVGNSLETFVKTIKNIFNLKLIVFIVIMSGFWLMFMQLFDMLPNFIVDWVDSSALVQSLGLPDWMLQANSQRAPQISQEWLINANAGLIVLFVVFVSWIVSRMRRVTSIFIGITLSSIGLMVAGFSMAGIMCLMGILLFSVGEMLSSPKMNEYLGVIAPDGKKGLYMGYANIPQGIGWAVGSVVAGDVYNEMGDKANLALDYLKTHQNISDISRPEAMNKLVEISGKSHQEVTNILWAEYDPYTLWYRFAALGIISAVLMIFYGMWVKKSEAPDI